MISEETLEQIRVLALASVVKQNGEYFLRYIFRWYSKEFATPLHVVESLPLEDILMHFYECRYEEMEQPHREEEIHRLIKSKEQLLQEKREEDAEDAELWEFAKTAVPLVQNKPVVVVKPTPTIQEPLPEGISLSFEDLK